MPCIIYHQLFHIDEFQLSYAVRLHFELLQAEQKSTQQSRKYPDCREISLSSDIPNYMSSIRLGDQPLAHSLHLVCINS